MHLAERTGGDSKVLAERSDGAATNIAGAHHHAVGRQILLLGNARLPGAADVHADFLESALLEQRRKPFTRGHATLVVAGARLILAPAFQQLDLSVLEILEDCDVKRHGAVNPYEGW